MNNKLIDRGTVMIDYLERLGRADSYKAKYEALAAAVDNAPAVDAEPVRHGYNATFTHPTDQYICPECGFVCEITELRYDEDGRGDCDAYEYDCKFCPDCGARMDGGE